VVDVQDDACVCSRRLDMVTVPPGQARPIFATFEPPPGGVREVDLVVPGFGFVRHVRIT